MTPCKPTWHHANLHDTLQRITLVIQLTYDFIGLNGNTCSPCFCLKTSLSGDLMLCLGSKCVKGFVAKLKKKMPNFAKFLVDGNILSNSFWGLVSLFLRASLVTKGLFEKNSYPPKIWQNFLILRLKRWHVWNAKNNIKSPLREVVR